MPIRASSKVKNLDDLRQGSVVMQEGKPYFVGRVEPPEVVIFPLHPPTTRRDKIDFTAKHLYASRGAGLVGLTIEDARAYRGWKYKDSEQELRAV